MIIRKIVLTAIAIGLFTPLCVQAAISQDTVKETIVKHSIEMNIDPALALSIAKKESNYNHELKSCHGAVGVFQLMPSTAKRMGYNPYYLSDNVKAGLTYYKMMYKMFGSTELALAAYNAGPTSVKKFGAVPPYSETKRFVSIIMNDYNKLKSQPDPVLAKYMQQTVGLQKPAVAPDVKTEVKEAPKKPESAKHNEIPEVKQAETTMEVL